MQNGSDGEREIATHLAEIRPTRRNIVSIGRSTSHFLCVPSTEYEIPMNYGLFTLRNTGQMEYEHNADEMAELVDTNSKKSHTATRKGPILEMGRNHPAMSFRLEFGPTVTGSNGTRVRKYAVHVTQS